MNEDLSSLELTLERAVKEYDKAIMRIPPDENEIRQAVEKCWTARLRLVEAAETRGEIAKPDLALQVFASANAAAAPEK